MIEREGFAFPVEVVYEKLPPICDYCGIIGHSISSCRQNSKKKEKTLIRYRSPRLIKFTLLKTRALSLREILNWRLNSQVNHQALWF